MYVYISHVYSAAKAKKQCQIPWNWSYTQLWAIPQVMGNKARYFRITSNLKYLAISLVPKISTFQNQ